MQLAVVTENLTTVRGDLVVSQQAVEEQTKLCDELQGQKLGMTY